MQKMLCVPWMEHACVVSASKSKCQQDALDVTASIPLPDVVVVGEDGRGHDLPGALGVEVVVVDAHALALLAGPVPALQVTMNMRQGQPAVDPQDMMITVAEVNPQHSRDAHVLDHKWRSQTNERCLVL